MFDLYKACYMWRKFAGLKQADILGKEKIPTISSFENGRSTNIKLFERYLELAVAMGQKADFDYFVNYQIEITIKRGKNNG